MTIPKPWLKSYDPGVPETLQPYPKTTLIDVVAETARLRPGHPALIFKGTTVSYGEMERQATAFAAALVANGVKKGDRVAILMPNVPQFVIAELGIWKAGGIVSSINPLYTGHELEHAINECGAEVLVVMTMFYDKVKEVQSKTKLRTIIAASIKEYLPGVLKILFTLLKEKKEGHKITLKSGDLWFQDMLKMYANAPAPNVVVKPEDPAIILFTGGTTGLSKAALGYHQGLVMTGLQVRSWFGADVMDEWNDVFLAVLPLFHVFNAVGLQSVAFMGRSPMSLIPNPRDIDDVLATIEKTKPTFFTSVPTLFIALLKHPKVAAGKADLSSIKLCISGAAALLAQTKVDFETATGGRIVEGYALTESMMAVTAGPAKGAYKVGSVGMPVTDVLVKIVDTDGETLMPIGEVGEICLQAPQLMRGYWERPDETAKMIVNDWLVTGDLGYLDEDGYLFIVDRKKDVIKPGGFQVWPREVEEVIAKHPAVMEVGVAGVPDDYQGEAVKAWIVLKEGQTATAEEIRTFCRDSLTGYKVPKHVDFRTELPKSAVGKVLRRELVKL